MAEWLRLMVRAKGSSNQWHAPRIKSYTITTQCDQTLAGPLEVANEGTAEREGRCPACASRLGVATITSAPTKRAPQSKPTARTPVVKKAATKKKSDKASTAKRSVRRSPRKRA